MKKLPDHLFFENAGSFMHPNESKYTATEIIADVLLTPLHLLGSLTRGGGEPQRAYLPPPSTPTYIPPPPPGKEELYAAAIYNYHRNCALIAASPLWETEKQALLDEERQLLTDTLRGILDQA